MHPAEHGIQALTPLVLRACPKAKLLIGMVF
jgi:hypothetical protein